MNDGEYIYIRMEELSDELKVIASKCERLAGSYLALRLPNSRRCLARVGERVEELGRDLHMGRVPE